MEHGEQETRERNERYRRIVENVDRLPSLPGIVTRLIEIVNSPESSAEDASSLIERDPALTGRMLRLANSAFYGMPRKVASVNSAVVILGFNSIKSLVLGAAVAKLFKPLSGGFDTRRFWMHSIICAMGSRLIIRHLMRYKMMDPESAFCAGIMHDIGRLILWHVAPADYTLVWKHALSHTLSLSAAEEDVLGIRHDILGRIVADKWTLPQDLEFAMVFHHRPQEAQQIPELAAAVHVADCMAHEIGHGTMENQHVDPCVPQSLSLLHIDADGYAKMTAELRSEKDKSHEFFSIIT